MKSKKIAILISIALLLTAAAIIVASFFVAGRTASILNGLGFGILGSAIVTFAISVGEYSDEKRVALENYYSEANAIKAGFTKLIYCECDEEADLLVADERESVANELWRKYFAGGINQSNEARSALINYYRKINIISDEATKQQIHAIIFTRKELVFEQIEKSIDSYLQASNISLRELENAYGRINYFTPYGNKKNRNWIYQNIHLKIRDSLQSIMKASYYFDKYKKDGLRGNLSFVYDQLRNVDSIFFSEAEFDKKEDNYEYYRVTASVVSDLEKNLEELRYRIYRDELSTVEPLVVMIRQINSGVDKNV